MRKVFLAIVVTLALILASCTTTKDLEKHPELVPVDKPKAGEKGIEAQQKPSSGFRREGKAPVDAAAGAEVPGTPQAEPSGTADEGISGSGRATSGG